MRRHGLTLLLAIVCTPFIPAAEGEREVWEAVFARDKEGRDQQIGFAHLKVEPVNAGGKTILRASRELNLTIRRDGQNAQLKATTGTDETADGKVVGIHMQQWIGEKQAVTMRGVVDESGRKVKVTVEANVKNEFENPWDPRVVGLSGESTMLRDRRVKPGDSFDYRIFEPTISHVAKIAVAAKDLEEVVLPRGPKRRLLRIESTPEKIQDVQLPASTIWADPETLDTVMTQIEMPGIGLLTMLRSDKKSATEKLGVPPDLMREQTINLNQRVQGGVHHLKSITYKVTVTGDADPLKILKADDRQTIVKGEGNSVEVTVESRKTPKAIAKPGEAPEEFLKSNFYINSDDDRVKKLATAAVGRLTDPWEKAKAIERWVRANMKGVNFTDAMATADHVAQTLSGDCSEYSMLTAAMCRAVGVPSRTAIGLVFVQPPTEGPGSLAFHMWTEVYVKGQWLAIDSTLGQGGVGPGHLKITDHSWHDERGFKPLLPVTGFMLAKPKIQIKSALTD